MPERPNGTALKAVEVRASVGSNPTPSAAAGALCERGRRPTVECVRGGLGTIAAAVLTVTLLAGSVDAAETKAVSARRWAGSVCRALTEWRDAVASEVEKLVLSPDATPQAQTTSLRRYLKAVIADTTDLVDALARAGRPKVHDGVAIAADVRGGVSDVRDGLRAVRRRALKLDPATPTFADGIVAVRTDGAGPR